MLSTVHGRMEYLGHFELKQSWAVSSTVRWIQYEKLAACSYRQVLGYFNDVMFLMRKRGQFHPWRVSNTLMMSSLGNMRYLCTLHSLNRFHGTNAKGAGAFKFL